MQAPATILLVIFSFSSTMAIIAVNAGPVARMDEETDGPMRSKLIKYSHLTSAGENKRAITKYKFAQQIYLGKVFFRYL